MTATSSEPITDPDDRSELEAPVWTVISFAGRERSGLTYFEALKLMASLDADKTPGLAIVTDDVGRRLKGS